MKYQSYCFVLYVITIATNGVVVQGGHGTTGDCQNGNGNLQIIGRAALKCGENGQVDCDGNCQCNPGYTGHHCERVDPCYGYNCGDGTCTIKHHDTATCACPDGYYGDHCEHLDPCDVYDCGPGICIPHPHGHIITVSCDCPTGYSGHHCERVDLCSLLDFDCGTGRCHTDHSHHNNTAVCECTDGFYGDHCQFEYTTVQVTTSAAPKPPTSSIPITQVASSTQAPVTQVPTTTQAPTSTMTTTTSSTATTTIPSPTTTTPTAKQYICNIAKTITDLATNVTEHNANASSCNPGDTTGSEALVLSVCNVEHPTSWRKGQNVMSICNSLPLYTPIATFSQEGFHSDNNDTAAIFVGCLDDAIRVGLQTCDIGTRIEHFTSQGTDYRNASQYFVIQ